MTKIVRVWELILFMVGIVVQLGGVAVTIHGARQVWKDVRTPDDRFLEPFLRFGRWIKRWTRRALGLPNPVRLGSGGAAITVSGHGRGYANWQALSDELSPQERIDLLDERFRATVDQVYKSMFAIQDSLEEKIEAIDSAQKIVAREADEAAKLEQRRVISGLRVEAYGFILLTLGTLVQAGGSYLGID